MVEHALREGSSGGGLSQVLGETEGFSDRQVSLADDQRSSRNGLLTNHNSSSLSESLIDSTHSVIRGLDFAEEDGLLEAGLSSEAGGVEDTSGSGNNLTSTSVNSVSVEGDILNVVADTSHVLLSHNTLLGSPLEGSFHRVLDFLEVLNLLSLIDKKVGTGSVRAEAPDLLGIIGIPLVFVLENLSSGLQIVFHGDFLSINGIGQIISEGLSLHVDSVVLVG
mmetsp:Transcript_12895/g.15989  ORF Transcript_12895/g.15989 Transcript_12895/m.15989 type:complete len:222 (-) Transcript_12895:1723-2388(-)